MRAGNNIFSAVQFLFVAAVIAAGFFFVAFPWAPHVRFKLAFLLTDRPDLFFSIGAMLLTIGLMLLVGFYTMYRKRFFQLSMRAPQRITFVEMIVLRSSVERYCREAFSTQMQLTDLFLHKDQKIEMVVQMPDLNGAERKAILERAEKELGRMLKRQMGYQRDFLLTVVVK